MSKDSHITWVAVADLSRILRTAPLGLVVGEQLLIAVRDRGQIIVYQGNCPHQAARLDRARITDGWLQCPHHRARFALATGVCGGGWDLPPLTRFVSRVADGHLWLTDPLRPTENAHADPPG